MRMKYFSLFAAAGIVAVMGYAPMASAADLGGDCCADLEERVADLEKTTARKGNRKVSLQIYGQVNRALLFWDDGHDSDVYGVDNDTSSTRIGFKGKAKINSDWSAGYKIEFQLEEDSGAKLDRESDDQGNEISIRKSYIYLKSKSLGTFSWGQNSTATDGVAETDLSGAKVLAKVEVESWVADFSFRDSTGGDIKSVESALPSIFNSHIDGGRNSVIRYDTPTIAGFKLSAAWGENDLWDVALRYKETWGDFKVAASIGYLENSEGTNDKEFITGSASVLHKPTGLNFTYARGQAEEDTVAGEDEYDYFKVGLYQKFNSLGKTALYGEYYMSESQDDDEVKMWGLGVVQKIDAAAMELYAGYRSFELDSDADAEDFSAVMAGGRIKF